MKKTKNMDSFEKQLFIYRYTDPLTWRFIQKDFT